jgi:charged multivesicular body protein 7
MSSYLSEFRPRDVNANHYDRKMEFWKQMIENYCDWKGSATFSIEELKINFKRNGTVPYCLQSVINQMSSEGNLVGKVEFMEKPKSWTGWAVDSLLVKPIGWGFSKVKERIITSPSDNEQKVFIVKSVVKHQANVLYNFILSHHKHKIISMDDLMKLVDDIEGLSKEGILYALQYLSVHEKKVWMEEGDETNQHHKILLKFADLHKTSQPITEIERSTYNLEHTENYLKNEIKEQELKIAELIKQALECKRVGKSKMALVYMKNKHRMEEDVLKKMQVLENIQNMLQTIRSSTSDKDIIDTYRMGSNAIKTTFSSAGMSLDNVNDIIEEMQEIFAEQEECQAAISEPIRSNLKYDDAELEKELLELANLNVNHNDNHKPNSGNVDKKQIINNDKLDDLDRELEERLKRLRSDFDDTTNPLVNNTQQTQQRNKVDTRIMT